MIQRNSNESAEMPTGLQKHFLFTSLPLMKQLSERIDGPWRKSRLAARLLLRKESRPLRPRELAAARQLSSDPEVTNRLIEQALYYLGIGHHKDALDRKLVDRNN